MCGGDCGTTYEDLASENRKLRTQVASLLEERGECAWAEEDPWGAMPDTWQTACGNLFSFTEGGPSENEVKFCCYCGKKLREIHAHVEEESDAHLE